MNQQRLQKAFYQTENGYETRIQYLEEVVHLLLARTNLNQSPRGPSAPLNGSFQSSADRGLVSLVPATGSFRYFKDKGLVPVLSKTAAKALSNDWRMINQHGGIHPIQHCRSASKDPSKTWLGSSRNQTGINAAFWAANAEKRCLKAALIDQTTQPAGAANDIDPHNLPLPSSNPASRPPSPRPSPTLISSQSDGSSVLPPPPLPQHKAASRSAASLVDLQLGSSIVPPSSPLPQPNTTSRPNADPKANTTPRQLHTSKPFPSSDQPVSDEINCDQATARPLTRPLPPSILLKDAPLQSLFLDCSLSSGRTESPNAKLNQTKPFTDAVTTRLCRSTPTSPIVSTDNNKKPPTEPLTRPHHPPSTTPSPPPMFNDLKTSAIIPDQQHPMPDDNLSSIVTPPELATAPLAPPESFESKSALSSTPNCSSSLICPTAQSCPENLEVAAVGGIEILDNGDINSIEARIAPEYSQSTLDYYNDIQEYLQQANADETETKKKKKKKKKKKANPTSTPDNPILFYV
ncbi:hypothetical protein PGT21_019112 [Puccinia graminis f. sp. tritici]|uniref:Uncharacterized protein n=1 Tax=Puccinia graminis f. sp. tritici TaxID=56615 RepID=A0A5B0QFM2_PUCGR|nr:hypothetical protein PGT21_019112 [Puccinia graminis f. sp. tritici]